MIIYHKNIDKINLASKTMLKYSNDYSFVPLQIKHKGEYINCIFQTPSLFIPYGLQENNNKYIIDLSFHNKINDKDLIVFERNLKKIFKIIEKEYNKYNVNNFFKSTTYDNCIRFKINKFTKFYDQFKNLTIAKPYLYGKFIIHLEGLWIFKNKDIWFQWTLLQGKLYKEIKINSYSFIDEGLDEDKYSKMIKMGVPVDAVNIKKKLDIGIPPPPPPLPNSFVPKKTNNISKIKPEDLQNIVLKKATPIKKEKIKNPFDPPSVEELQFTISRLKKSNIEYKI